MEPKDHYTPRDFKSYARKEFSDEFSTFREIYTCSFEHKTYLDENNAAHSVDVLPVGHYHRRQGGPPVWAQATSTGVRYYQGKGAESVITPIPEEHVTRIYYSAPYSSIIGPQEGRGRTASRKAGHYFVETIINVLFLLTGQLEKVNNPGKTDMLSNFRYVCLKTVPESNGPERIPLAASEPHELPPAPDVTEREHKKRKRIKQEEDADEDAARDPTNGSGPGQRSMQHLSSHSQMPHRLASSTPHTSLLDQIRNYEADMGSKLEQERQACFQEVRALQAKLDEQELRIQAAEEKSMREKKKRKRAEERVQELRSEIMKHKEDLGDDGIIFKGTERGHKAHDSFGGKET